MQCHAIVVHTAGYAKHNAHAPVPQIHWKCMVLFAPVQQQHLELGRHGIRGACLALRAAN